MRRHAILLLAVLPLLAALALALPALAQTGSGTPTPNEINAVARELWCPLCNGVRLDNCDLKACEQMREEIAQKLAAGESKEQIKEYFVARYGDVVLGAPAGEGFNLLVYVLPVLAAVVGIGWVAYFVVAWTRRRPAGTITQPPQAPGATPDDYLKRVDEELNRYE